MMKKGIILPAVLIFILLGTISGCGALFMEEEERAMIGLWRSSGWEDDYETCYYDFRPDGRVFVTDWTNDLETTNNIIVPNYFNYAIEDNVLEMKQIFGIIKFRFRMIEDGSSGDSYYLHTLDESFEYSMLEYGEDLYFYRLDDYSNEARTVRAFLEGFDNE